MMDLIQLLAHSFIFGLLLSAVMVISFILAALVNPEIWLKDYPPDIRENFGPMSARATQQRTLVGIPVFALMTGIIVYSIAQLAPIKGSEPSFVDIFVSVFVILFVFNLVDLLILDWLIFVTIRPRIIVLPGTEGAAGYSDYGFHLRASLKGLAGSFVASLLIAGIAVLVFALV